MALIERGNLLVEVAEDGAGPPVLLLHSSVAGNRQWKKLTEELRGRYRVSAPNLYGYGKTTAWNAADGMQTLEAALQPVLAVLERIDGPVRVVGHSWGGAVGVLLAARLGERVSHLVLYEPMLAGLLREHGARPAWQEVEALYKDVKRHGGAGEWDALAARFTNYFNGDGAWEATPPDRQKMVASLLGPNYHEWDAIEQPIGSDHYAGVRARTLLIRSANTRPAIREMSEVLRAQYPAWQFREIDTGGHMAPLTRPDLVNPLIADFLDAA